MIRKTLLATSLILASTSSMAASDAVMSNFSYDYIDARIAFSPTTFGAGITKSIHPNAHLIATADSEFDGDYSLAGGLGFHAPINNWADLTGEMLLHYVDNNRQYDDDFGVEFNLGVRQWLGPQFEVGGKVGYTSIDDQDEVLFNVSGRFHPTELFSLGIEGIFNGIYDDQIMFTARFKY